jgi:hypothetical protein
VQPAGPPGRDHQLHHLPDPGFVERPADQTQAEQLPGVALRCFLVCIGIPSSDYALRRFAVSSDSRR